MPLSFILTDEGPQTKFDATGLSETNWQFFLVVLALLFRQHHIAKVAMYRHRYRAEPKEPTQFGSVSGSEIQNLPFSLSGIVSLYRPEPKEPT